MRLGAGQSMQTLVAIPRFCRASGVGMPPAWPYGAHHMVSSVRGDESRRVAVVVSRVDQLLDHLECQHTQGGRWSRRLGVS